MVEMSNTVLGELVHITCDLVSILINTMASVSSFNIGAHALKKYANSLLARYAEAKKFKIFKF